MRKVMFNKWQPALWDVDANDTNAKPVYQDEKPDVKEYPNAVLLKSAGYQDSFTNAGYFHVWGSLEQSPIAVIEDNEGYLHEIPPQHIQFVELPTPPNEYYIGHLTTGEAVVMPLIRPNKLI